MNRFTSREADKGTLRPQWASDGRGVQWILTRGLTGSLAFHTGQQLECLQVGRGFLGAGDRRMLPSWSCPAAW